MAWIYIVEDDSSIREIERFALQNSGYQVREFACGKDFYTEVSQRTPDCVLLDILLPDEDGLEILTKFRAMPGMRRIPVMMVTAKTTELDKVKGLDMGADDYITKPFGIMELISRVKHGDRGGRLPDCRRNLSGWCQAPGVRGGAAL